MCFLLLQVRIICSASAPLSSLFLHQYHDSELEQSRILMDDLGLSQVGDIHIIFFIIKKLNCFWFGMWLQLEEECKFAAFF